MQHNATYNFRNEHCMQDCALCNYIQVEFMLCVYVCVQGYVVWVVCKTESFSKVIKLQ